MTITFNRAAAAIWAAVTAAYAYRAYEPHFYSAAEMTVNAILIALLVGVPVALTTMAAHLFHRR